MLKPSSLLPSENVDWKLEGEVTSVRHGFVGADLLAEAFTHWRNGYILHLTGRYEEATELFRQSIDAGLCYRLPCLGGIIWEIPVKLCRPLTRSKISGAWLGRVHPHPSFR